MTFAKFLRTIVLQNTSVRLLLKVAYIFSRFSGLKVDMISVLKFSDNAFETAKFWRIVDLTAILRLLQKEKLHFSLICIFA